MENVVILPGVPMFLQRLFKIFEVLLYIILCLNTNYIQIKLGITHFRLIYDRTNTALGLSNFTRRSFI